MNRSYPRIIDGGLASYLETQGHDLNHKLWSAKLLSENPQAIREAHLAFLRAGAQCIITASYQASFPGYVELGIPEKDAEALMLKSVELGLDARKEFLLNYPGKGPVWVAASIGPYGAYLADGSEYTGNYACSKEELKDFHSRRLAVFVNSQADFLACETIPSLQEAKVICDLLSSVEKPAWISFSCKDEKHLNDGTPIQEAMSLFLHHPSIFAVGVNCTAPQFISPLIQAIRSAKTQKRIIVYPNSGESYDASDKSWSEASPQSNCAKLAKEWFQEGADIVGGCCRIRPEDIAEMAKL